MRRIGVVGIVLAVVLVAAGCTPAGGDTAAPDEGTVDGSGVPHAAEVPAFDGAASTLTQLLDGAGVAVVALEDAPDAFADHVVVLTEDQVLAMTDEVVAGSGTPASTIDYLAGSSLDDPDVPPISYVLAGWARDWTGAGAAAARSLMGEHDWTLPESLVWPDATLALFLADITADIPAADRALASRGDAPSAPEAAVAASALSLHTASVAEASIGDLCTAGANFVQNALATLYRTLDAIAERAEKGIGGFFGKIVGLGVKLVGEVVHTVVDAVNAVLDKILAPIRSALAVIGIIQQVGSAVEPWTVKISADPGEMVSASTPVPGTFTAAVASKIPDFPGWVRDCASAIGLELPRPPGPGSTLHWTFAPAIGTKATALTAATQTVGDDGTSKFEYEANADPPEAWDGDPLDIWIDVSAQADRTEIERLSELADKLIDGALSSIPEVVRGYARQLVDLVRGEAVTALTKLLTPAASGSKRIPFTIHTPPTEDPEAPHTIPDAASAAYCAALAGYAEFEFAWLSSSDLDVGDVYARQADLYAQTPAEVKPPMAELIPSVDNDPGYAGDAFEDVQGWVDRHCTTDYRSVVLYWFTMAKWFRSAG
ncbi:hypothetical protein [Microbacterium jejuense]|uniref:hypothetical protein n=1 Tax=Microbacterium jejuense TaxID=1263637 RepID=UPI0031E6EC62